MFLLDSATLDLLILYFFPFNSGDLMMGLPSETSLSGLVLVIWGLKVSMKPLSLLHLIYLSKWGLFISWKVVEWKIFFSFFFFFVCLAPDFLWNEISRTRTWQLPCPVTPWLIFPFKLGCVQAELVGKESFAFLPTGQWWNPKLPLKCFRKQCRVFTDSFICQGNRSFTYTAVVSNCCWHMS